MQLLLGNATFQIRAGVHAGRGVALKVDQVAIAGFSSRLQKMIEGDFVKRGGGGKSGNVAANAFLDLVGAHHHGQRIPAHHALDAALHFLAAGKGRLLPRSDGVLVGSGGGKGKIHAGRAPRVQRQLLQQSSRPLRATLGQNIVQRIEPLSSL